jgi:hypothetical protein
VATASALRDYAMTKSKEAELALVMLHDARTEVQGGQWQWQV